MKLTTENVEAFLLLYAENELDAATRAEVEAFLAENPSYKELLADYDPAFRLPEPPAPAYPRKSALLRTAVIPMWVRWAGSAAAVLLLLAGTFAVWHQVGRHGDALDGNSSLVAVVSEPKDTIQRSGTGVGQESPVSQEQIQIAPMASETMRNRQNLSARNVGTKQKKGGMNMKNESSETLLAEAVQPMEPVRYVQSKKDVETVEKANTVRLMESVRQSDAAQSVERLEMPSTEQMVAAEPVKKTMAVEPSGNSVKEPSENHSADIQGMNQPVQYVMVYSFEADSVSTMPEEASFGERLPVPENVRTFGKLAGKLFARTMVERYPQANEKLVNVYEKAEMFAKPLASNFLKK